MWDSRQVVKRMWHVGAGIVAVWLMAWGGLGLRASAAPRGTARADLLGFRVEWRRVTRGDESGDAVEIVPRGGGIAYRHFRDGDYVESVARWAAPMYHPDADGVLLTLMPGAGTARSFVVVARGRSGRLAVVLDVTSNKVGERGLESVDLDGDTYPELLVVPDYGDFYGVAGAKARTQAWKWSPSRQRYVMVREGGHADRLSPLHLAGFK